MAQLYVLFEHATGYSLFKVTEFEEISSLTVQVQKSVADINAFKSIVELVAFQPFTTGRDALENINSICEGILHQHLQLFLENNLPKSKKKRPITLGLGESKLGALISEVFGITCSVSGAFPELIRGIRCHFHELIKSIKDLNSTFRAQLGLGHHFSRSKVKFNVNKIDNMIIQSIHIVDQLDKDINTFSMRIREWYSFHFPELIKVVPENHLYIKCVGLIKDRLNMSDDIEEKLESVLMDSTKAQNIIELARSSMGMEICAMDMENVTEFAERIGALIVRRKELMEYLKSKMHNVAPNLATLIGETVGARLIAHAGSLINLAKFPASTVQILGAEKALFRALKTRGNTPKYGLIYHSTFIGRAGKTNKGRISRYLANKCSVASRIDCFREFPTDIFGLKLRQQVEDRLTFYETGEIPAKNVDVMTIALDEADVVSASMAKEKRKSEKREKKRLSKQMENITHSFNLSTNEEDGQAFEPSIVNSEKKKKKKHSIENADSIQQEEIDNGTTDNVAAALAEKERRKAEKREKKRLSKQMENSQNSFNISTNADNEESFDQGIFNSEKKKKKKKRKRSIENGDDDQDIQAFEDGNV